MAMMIDDYRITVVLEQIQKCGNNSTQLCTVTLAPNDSIIASIKENVGKKVNDPSFFVCRKSDGNSVVSHTMISGDAKGCEVDKSQSLNTSIVVVDNFEQEWQKMYVCMTRSV